MKNNNNSHNIGFMDGLRSLSLFLTVLSHIGFIMFGELDLSYFSLGPRIMYKKQALNIILYCIGKIGLNIFFIISGFLIVHNGIKYNRLLFLINRIFKLLPVYFISLAICYSIQYVSSYYWGSSFHTSEEIIESLCLKDIFFLDDRYSILGVSWTLKIEIIFYALYLIFKPLFKSENLQLLSIVFYTIITIFILKYKFIGQYLGIIYSGVLIYFNKHISAFLLILTICILSILSPKLQSASVLCAIVSYIIVVLGSPFIKDKKIYKFLRNISYSAYLIHFVTLCVFFTIAYHDGYYLMYIIPFPLVILISYFIYKYIERPIMMLFYYFFKIDRINNPR